MAYNITKMDEGFIRPQAMVGPVIMNGGVHTNLCSRARTAKAPYYPLAIGTFSNNQANISHADLVFTVIRTTVALHANNSSNAIRLLGISTLNGLGEAVPGGNEILLDNLNVLGFAEVPNTPNNQGYYNIIAGGILTVRNNSKWTIQVGDYLMAYAPTLEEAKDGGHGREADKYGERKLWLKTYDPVANSLTGKPIYRALKDGKKAGCVPPYIETAKGYLSGAKDQSLSVMSACFDSIKEEFQGGKVPNHQGFLLAMCAEMDKPKKTEEIRDKLFVTYSGAQHKLDSQGAPNSLLNKRQAEGTDKFLLSGNLLHHYVHKNVLCQAMSTADPTKNLSVQMIRYSK